ncbi:MAG: hypothetical protein ACOCP4_01535 [Candidatus Woesearchaeota archaeon]
MKFIKYLNEKSSMQSTMIGFRIDETKIQNVIDYVESWLVRYNVPYEHVETKHISVAQILDKARKDELVRVIHKISPSYKFRVKKLTLFNGKEWDFFVLELYKTKNFTELFNQIKEKYNVVEYQGGVKPHISIIKIEKGIASDEFLADVIRDAPLPKQIKAKKVDLWNPKFQIEYTKKR